MKIEILVMGKKENQIDIVARQIATIWLQHFGERPILVDESLPERNPPLSEIEKAETVIRVRYV